MVEVAEATTATTRQIQSTRRCARLRPTASRACRRIAKTSSGSSARGGAVRSRSWSDALPGNRIWAPNGVRPRSPSSGMRSRREHGLFTAPTAVGAGTYSTTFAQAGPSSLCSPSWKLTHTTRTPGWCWLDGSSLRSPRPVIDGCQTLPLAVVSLPTSIYSAGWDHRGRHRPGHHDLTATHATASTTR